MMNHNQLQELLSNLAPEARLEATEARADEWGDLCLLAVNNAAPLSRDELREALAQLPLSPRASLRFGHHDPVNWEEELEGEEPEDYCSDVLYVYYDPEQNMMRFAVTG